MRGGGGTRFRGQGGGAVATGVRRGEGHSGFRPGGEIGAGFHGIVHGGGRGRSTQSYQQGRTSITGFGVELRESM